VLRTRPSILLVWPILREHVWDIVDHWHYVDTSAGNPHQILVVYVDDASFSGEQIKQYFNWNRFYNSVIGPSKGRVKLMFVLSALSSLARKAIDNITDSSAIFPTGVIPMPTADELLQKMLGEDGASKFWSDYHKLIPDHITGLRFRQTLTYFDHKLPDMHSMATKILALAPVLSKDGEKASLRSLITGCSPASYGYKSNSVWRKGVDEFYDVKSDALACPPSFYKFIQYMFNGEKASKFHSLIKVLGMEGKQKEHN